MSNTSASFIIRPGTPDDIPAVHELIVELAIYERAEGEVENTLEELKADGFGPDSIYELLVVEQDGVVQGMALWYVKYSTWKGRCGYLEDLVVRASHRGKGMGKALFEAVATTCAERNYRRMEWQVLDWNEPAIEFYQSLGATLDPEWMNGKLSGTTLRDFAS